MRAIARRELLRAAGWAAAGVTLAGRRRTPPVRPRLEFLNLRIEDETHRVRLAPFENQVA